MMGELLWLPAWMVASAVAMSFIEYGTHRYFMHGRHFAPRAFEAHAVLHHGRYFRKSFSHDADPAARHLNIDLHPGYSLLTLAPLWLPLCWLSLVGGLTFACVIASHSMAWTMLHREMHDPAGRWFANTKMFRYLRDYHEVHHAHPGSNFNAVLPGVDWLMGTLRREKAK